VVDEKVREKIRGLIGERSTGFSRRSARNHFPCRQRGCVAVGTAYLFEPGASILAGWCRSRGSRRSEHSNEVGKRLNV
jgi:hypothetical protein